MKKTYTEAEFRAVEAIASTTGKIFGGTPVFSIWMAMPFDRKRAAEASAMAVEKRQKWQGKTLADIRAKAAELDDRGDGQVPEWYYLRDVAEEAAEHGGLDVAEILEECDALDAGLASRRSVADAENRVATAARELSLAPFRAEAAVLAKRIGGHSEYLAERLASGVTAAAILAERQALSDSGGPDTWGYAHGTDFEGGDW